MAYARDLQKGKYPISGLQNPYFNKLLSAILHVLYTVMLFVSVIFIRVRHPVRIGFILVCHAVFVSLAAGLFSGLFLYSYIIYLVILGGVLVLFLYMTSLVSNVTFRSSNILLGVSVVLFAAALVSIGLAGSPLGRGPSSQVESAGSYTCVNLVDRFAKLYSAGSGYVTIFLVVYLLFALLVCVEIVNLKSGPLRKFN